MGLFKRKSDPIAEKKRALNEQIAQLEARIKQLSSQPVSASPPVQPASRPSPQVSAPITPAAPAPMKTPVPPAPTRKPAPKPLPLSETPPPTEMYNEMGVRKFDLAELFRRITQAFKTPPPSNPHLVKYLASGGLPGMRALRYEKRVARNRFLGLVVGFSFLLWVIWAIFLRNR
jgi:hypothetical protein